MDIKERVVAAASLTSLVGIGMLLGWAYLGTDYWWVAVVMLFLAPVTLFMLTRNN